MTVLIAGGGIGGLTLALSLHQIGVNCRIFESVPALKPLGVGINVLPHAVRELIDLGLLDKLDAIGVRTKELSFYSKHGKPIWSEPRGLEAGYHWPQFSIHRGMLQQILYDAVLDRLGDDAVLTSHYVKDWRESDAGINLVVTQKIGFLSLNCGDGLSQGRELRGQKLVEHHRNLIGKQRRARAFGPQTNGNGHHIAGTGTARALVQMMKLQQRGRHVKSGVAEKPA